MASFINPTTSLSMGDPDFLPLGAGARPTEEALDAFLARLILSASGWRTVFAADGSEESSAPDILPEGAFVASAAASCFAAYVKKASGRRTPTLVLALDSRPTGPAIGAAMARTFMAEGCAVRYLFVAAAPEVMAYARTAGALPEDDEGRVDGFAYVSASHNPIGHNGLKFGLVDGGVVPGPEAALLIADFKAQRADKDRVAKAAALMASVPGKAVSRLFSDTMRAKRASQSAYALFTREVVTGTTDPKAQERFYDRIAGSVAERPLGVVADFNGSARTVSIDSDALGVLGVKVERMNGQCGRIAHRIVPEGESLEPCRAHLESLHASEPAFVLGYVPDCDGDRGNVVVWDDTIGAARALGAQEVFALCCVAELAHLAWSGGLRYDEKGNALDKVAVAINDPTSMRVDRIAAAFDVDVFRAEVGEANVVGLARKPRSKGYQVRILGEGAAGGNITHPSAVRDPIDTVFALIKLLTLRSDAQKCGLFETWCDLSGQAELYKPDFGISDVIASLPAFTTTGAYEEAALMRVKSEDHGALKDRYQAIFLADWEAKKEDLARRAGLHSWTAIAYNGMEERRSPARFGEAGRGGLKILFADAAGHPKAYVWMRGSGTEPVFRVMADLAGPDRRLERELLEWRRSMVARADA